MAASRHDSRADEEQPQHQDGAVVTHHLPCLSNISFPKVVSQTSASTRVGAKSLDLLNTQASDERPRNRQFAIRHCNGSAARPRGETPNHQAPLGVILTIVAGTSSMVSAVDQLVTSPPVCGQIAE
jgi:hypothetical protein